jgi:hypothetical protein
MGRLENIYYLKQKGVNFLSDEIWYSSHNIKYPQNLNSLFFRDYFHRIYTIEFHITLLKYLVQNNWTIKTFDTYFDKIWNNRKDKNLKAKTKLFFNDGTYFIPDAICLYYKKEKPHIITFEMYRGKDSKRVIQQLTKHLKSLNEWLPSKVFNKKIGSKVVCLFESKNSMQSVIKAFNEDSNFNNFRYLFIFGYLENSLIDFTKLIYCDNSQATL